MKKEVWGPITWKALHCLTIKIKDEYFLYQKDELINIIISMMSNLPCPNCTAHALGLIKKYNLKRINDKQLLIRALFMIHNDVNKRLKKSLFKYESVEPTYSIINLKESLEVYYDISVNQKYGEKMMIYNFHRKAFLKNFRNYIQKNIIYFNE